MTILHNPGAPRVLNSISPSRLELTLLLIKERKKKLRYLGSYLQHYNDRAYLYNGMGGLKGTKFIVERHHHRAQFCHPTLHSERYDVRTVKIKGSEMNNMLGNFTRNTWDCSIASDNLFQDGAFRRQLTAIHQEEAIELLEGWGVKYILLDEIRKPTVQDSIYVRHKLYIHNFPYIPDPVTNAYYGDADWKWKGEEKIDYSNYGASTKDERNSFQSLWSAAEKAAGKTMAMSNKSAGPTPTPPAGNSSPKPTPAAGNNLPKPTPTPTAGNSSPKPTPAAGNNLPKSTPTPTAGNSSPKPIPTPPAGNNSPKSTPTPAAGNSSPKPTPAAGNNSPKTTATSKPEGAAAKSEPKKK